MLYTLQSCLKDLKVTQRDFRSIFLAELPLTPYTLRFIAKNLRHACLPAVGRFYCRRAPCSLVNTLFAMLYAVFCWKANFFMDDHKLFYFIKERWCADTSSDFLMQFIIALMVYDLNSPLTSKPISKCSLINLS